MSTQSTTAPAVKVLEQTEDYNYHDKYRIIRARLQYRRGDGSWSDPVTRINFERGEAAAVLLVDPERDVLVFVRQLRYPVYATLPPEDSGRAWLLEIIAGIQEKGQTPEETARREAGEESGYEIQGDLERLAEVYVSPGASSERVTIFLGRVDSAKRTGDGGGLAEEGESTEIVVLPRADALAMLARGEIQDAKTVIALQQLAQRPPESLRRRG